MLPETEAADVITFDVAATLDDQTQYNEYLLAQPEARRLFAIRLALALLVYPVIGLAIGFCLGTLAGGHLPTPAMALAQLSDDPWFSFLLPWSVLAGTTAIAFLVFRMLRRPLLRRRNRRLLKERAGIDPTDPQLTEHVRCTFGPEGYTVVSQGYTHHAAWAGIKALRETPDLLLVMTGLWFGYVIPKRDIPPKALEAIRALAARRLNPQLNPGGAAA